MESLQVLTDEQQQQVCGGGAVTTADLDYAKEFLLVSTRRLQVRLERRIKTFFDILR